jgi:hypothetical protein
VSARPTTTSQAPPAPPAREQRENGDLVAFLERDQLTADTSVPLPRAPLGTHARMGLWALRVFVTIVAAMVVYAFVAQLA